MRLETPIRSVVGPLAGLAFFLPWVSGQGALSAVDFTGLRLVAFSGALDGLFVGLIPAVLLLLLQLLIAGVAVAAIWNAVLAPALRWHPLYRWSGWYLVVGAAALLAAAAFQGNLASPPLGALLLAAAAATFMACEASRWRLRLLTTRAHAGSAA